MKDQLIHTHFVNRKRSLGHGRRRAGGEWGGNEIASLEIEDVIKSVSHLFEDI